MDSALNSFVEVSGTWAGLTCRACGMSLSPEFGAGITGRACGGLQDARGLLVQISGSAP